MTVEGDTAAIEKDSLLQLMDSLAKEMSKPTVVDSTMLQCYVIDSQTGDSIPYANALYQRLKIGASGDAEGHFSIVRQAGEQLTVTSVGYKPRRIKITDSTPMTLNVSLVPDSKQAARRWWSRRKEGISIPEKTIPAVELMRRVIAAKKQDSPLRTTTSTSMISTRR